MQLSFQPLETTHANAAPCQGLAIARHVIVNKHAGTIGFETQTGKGMTFAIRIAAV